MPKKLLISLASVLALATFAMAPAAVQAFSYKSNGVKIGATHENVTLFGPLTLKNAILGEFKCKIVAGAPVWNAEEKALDAVEGWEPYVCTYSGNQPPCKEQAFVTAEGAVELIEEGTTEKTYTAKRGLKTMPWPGEIFETTEKTKSLNLHKIRMYIDCPPTSLHPEGVEIPFEGNLEPKYINGAKNGLDPSKLVFEGKGGKTSWLGTCNFGAPCETEEHNLYVNGELTLLGTSQQLITVGSP
jgi:hypothetical protein